MKSNKYDIENFKSGSYQSQGDFSSFLPSMINRPWTWSDPEISMLLENASMEIGGLNSFSDLIPNIEIYIEMHIQTEANKSNKIEGTKTSIEEDLMSVEDVLPEKRDDHQEVQNYILALNHGIDRITKDDFPLCNRLIGEMHRILLQGVRGENKTPGEIRHSQNWIGGSMPSNAVYVPPAHMELPELLSDYEKFINNDTLFVPDLIKVAILHYQFETIHPYQDGNGRIGRLIIPLYLLEKRILSKPCFYISDYLERHRTEYYDALNRVRLNNDLVGWIKFFLTAVIETAKSGKTKFKNVTQYVKDLENNVRQFSGRTDNAIKIIRAFYDRPVLTSKQLVSITRLSQPTVDALLKKMVKANILTELTGFSRNRIFILLDYLRIFDNH